MGSWPTISTASAAASAQEQGLVRGTDYFLVAAGDTATAQVSSVLMTRAALDRVLDDLEFARSEAAAARRALDAAQSMIATRDRLDALIAEQQANKWFTPLVTAAGAFLGGYIIGQEDQGVPR